MARSPIFYPIYSPTNKYPKKVIKEKLSAFPHRRRQSSITYFAGLVKIHGGKGLNRNSFGESDIVKPPDYARIIDNPPAGNCVLRIRVGADVIFEMGVEYAVLPLLCYGDGVEAK